MSENLMGQDSEPPPYEEWAHPSTGSSLANQNLYQPQLNSKYAPVQYNLPGQDPQEFYGVLIDGSNRPSKIFCRMADALFFHMDQHCNQFQGTRRIEPAKIAWLGVTLGHDAERSIIIQQHLPSLYDAASIPYTFNNTQTPVLDRRGLLHLCVFEVCADPAYAQQKWNKIINVLNLHDPLTNLPYPTPIPCSAFPSISDLLFNQVYTNWKMKAATQILHQASNAIPTQYREEINVLHNSLAVQIQRAVPIARRSAFQTTHRIDGLQRIQGEKSTQPEISQNPQAQTLKMVGMVEGMNREQSGSLDKSPTAQTAQVQQAAPIARLAAFQTVQQIERLQIPTAKNNFTQPGSLLNTLKGSYTQDAALSRASGASREEEVDKGLNNGLRKSSTAQQAISIARRAAFQTVQQTKKVEKIQAWTSG